MQSQGRGAVVSYTLQLRGDLSVLSGDRGHRPLSGRVLVSVDTRQRWAELTCSCGASAVARWRPGIQTYRELLVLAWDDSCGSTAQRAV